MNREIMRIFNKAYDGGSLDRSEIISLLSLEDASTEASIMRGVADAIVRERTGNTGVIFAQIGMSVHPCPGNCSYCSCAEKYSMMPTFTMDDDAIAAATRDFTEGDQLFGLWLMGMADFELEEYLRMSRVVMKNRNGSTNLYTNIGDATREQFEEIKKAGFNGVYHCWRLGEGRDTMFTDRQRQQTMINAREAGLDLLDALEPIGVEHTPEELTDHILFSREMETIQYGAMKRVSVPGTSFENIPEISEFTLSKYAAAVALAMAGMKKFPWIGIHEPCIHGYMSGANLITAEAGVNPRDTELDTAAGRGLDIADCRRMLRSAGYEFAARGDGSRFEL